MAAGIVRYQDAGAFLERVEDHLIAAEAHNNLILGLSANLRDQPARFGDAVYMASIEDRGQVTGAALRTNLKRALALSAMAGDNLPLLVADLATQPLLTAAVGPAATVRAFADAWCHAAGTTWVTHVDMSIYCVHHVRKPAGVRGNQRTATEDDIPLLQRWLIEFSLEALGQKPDEDHELQLRRQVRDGRWFIWEVDGQPVTMAGSGRRTPNGAIISGVYTSPSQRCNGFASACVAALSQHFLDEGYRFCALFADRANPTSNSIYRRMGYEPAGESLHVTFAEPQ